MPSAGRTCTVCGVKPAVCHVSKLTMIKRISTSANPPAVMTTTSNLLAPFQCAGTTDIAKAQTTNPASLEKCKTNKDCSDSTFGGCNKDHKLTCHERKTASVHRRLCNKTQWRTGIVKCPGILVAQPELRQLHANILTGKVCA
jgi:hypothetical protein